MTITSRERAWGPDSLSHALWCILACRWVVATSQGLHSAYSIAPSSTHRGLEHHISAITFSRWQWTGLAGVRGATQVITWDRFTDDCSISWLDVINVVAEPLKTGNVNAWHNHLARKYSNNSYQVLPKGKHLSNTRTRFPNMTSIRWEGGRGNNCQMGKYSC